MTESEITYGSTVKKIRQQKGFLMKEVYLGILGRTTAYRFEQGTTNISTEKLRRILMAMGINSMDEFLYLHRKHHYLPEENLDRMLSVIIDRENLDFDMGQRTSVLQFYEANKDSRSSEGKFYAYVAHLDVLLNQEKEMRMPEEFRGEYQFIENYLLAMESWTLRELRLFPSLSCCFNDDARPLLMARFKKSYANYRDYEDNWEEGYTNNLLNYCMVSVMLKKYADIQKNTRELEEIFAKNPSLHWDLINKTRLIFLRAFCGALKQDDEVIQLACGQLESIKSVIPANSSLMEFYFRYVKKKVLEVYPGCQVEM